LSGCAVYNFTLVKFMPNLKERRMGIFIWTAVGIITLWLAGQFLDPRFSQRVIAIRGVI
jgi:hypothetical protein